MRHRLPEIAVPTLITSGHYVECAPAQAETIKNAIPGAE